MNFAIGSIHRSLNFKHAKKALGFFYFVKLACCDGPLKLHGRHYKASLC